MKPLSAFNIRKAAQVVAYFATKAGGEIDVLKAAKLLYLADREFMTRYDVPILNDQMVSMDHGPVTSITLNLINNMYGRQAVWDEFIKGRVGYKLAAIKVKPDALDELSPAELEVMADIWTQFGSMNTFKLRDWTHDNCPEWEDPKGSSTPIPYERIFKFLGKKNAEELDKHIAEERRVSRLLSAI